MKYGNFFILYAVLLVLQVILTFLLDFTQLFTPALLPAMILCIPLTIGTPVTILIAFASGLLIDFFSGGVPGMTSAALLPVAFLKGYIMKLFFDDETFERIEELSIRKLGLLRIMYCAIVMTFLFLVIYVWIDGAGTRPFGFNLERILISTALNILPAIVAVDLLLSRNNKRI